MNPLMNVQYQTQGPYRIGDKVRAKHGWRGVVGEIIEDCGNIGRKGRRVYTVRWKIEDEPEIMSGEDDLEPAAE